MLFRSSDINEAIRLNPNEPAFQANKKDLDNAIAMQTESESKLKDFAARSKTDWRTNTTTDRMTGLSTTKVFHQGKIGTGSYMVDLKCFKATQESKPVVEINITLHGVTAPTTRRPGIVQVDGRWRKNGNVTGFSYFQDGNWSNVFRIIMIGAETGFNDVSISKTGSWVNRQNQIIYDLAFEFPTSSGAIFVEMPPGNPAVNKIARECVN